MEIILLLARLALALVFAVAGAAKLADLAGSRRALLGFGLPETLASPLGVCLPFVEILIALALIPLESAWWGAIAALALLTVFGIGVGVSLAGGRAPECHCFGQLHSEPVSGSTLARILVLTAVAGFIVAQGNGHSGLSALSWLSGLEPAQAGFLVLNVSGVGLLLAAVLLLRKMLREQAALRQQIEAIKFSLDEEFELVPIERKRAALPIEGLPVGAAAPNFSVATLGGDQVSLDRLLEPGKPLLLLFTGPSCFSCKTFLPVVKVWERDHRDRLTIAVLGSGSRADNRKIMETYRVGHLFLQGDSGVAEAYHALWTPAAVLVDPDGKIASQIVFGDDAIRVFVRDLLASSAAGPTPTDEGGSYGRRPQVSIRYSVLEIGEQAPELSLPDLSGRVRTTQDLLGSPSILLLWHPDCRYCRAMVDDLRNWEAHPPEGAPKLVLIGTGDSRAIRNLNKDLKSPTLLDPDFDLGPLFGTRQTPSAILIDDEGRIASGLAIGDQNTRALIGLPRAQELQASQT